MFENGFPIELNSELHRVLENISKTTYTNCFSGTMDTASNEQYELLDGTVIDFPYRIYFIDDDSLFSRLTTLNERLIYHCIFTRSCDGYVREKHLRAIMTEDYPEWCMPYILKLSSEYVVEILEVIYEFMYGKDNALFQVFCQNNPYLFRYYHSRMISYWNEFYRDRCYRYHNYVGYKLYRECFGFRRSNEKIGENYMMCYRTLGKLHC